MRLNKSRWRVMLPGVAALAFFGATACNLKDLSGVHDPDTIPPSYFNGPQGLPVLLAGAQARFQIAFSGAGDIANNGHEGQVNMSGLFTDELVDLETFPTRQQVDARQTDPSNASLTGTFEDLAGARQEADQAVHQYQKFAPASNNHGLALIYSANTYLMFAEYYCDGVPFSNIDFNGHVTYGTPITRAAIRQIAIAKFDSALAILASLPGTSATDTANDSSWIYLARVGKARTLVDSGDLASAQAIANTVPNGYVFLVENSNSTPVENNGIWNYMVAGNFFGAADVDGGTGLNFVSANDHRVQTVNTGLPGALGFGPNQIQALKYPSATSPTVLASGLEARLINAEAQLKSGNVAGWRATLSAIRTDSGMSALTADSTTIASPTLRLSVLFRERAFWLYLTGHRMEDMRRLVRQYGRDPATVFPSQGITPAQLPYGAAVDFPVSQDENNNPNFHGCLNRNA